MDQNESDYPYQPSELAQFKRLIQAGLNNDLERIVSSGRGNLWSVARRLNLNFCD